MPWCELAGWRAGGRAGWLAGGHRAPQPPRGSPSGGLPFALPFAEMRCKARGLGGRRMGAGCRSARWRWRHVLGGAGLRAGPVARVSTCSSACCACLVPLGPWRLARTRRTLPTRSNTSASRSSCRTLRLLLCLASGFHMPICALDGPARGISPRPLGYIHRRLQQSPPALDARRRNTNGHFLHPPPHLPPTI